MAQTVRVLSRVPDRPPEGADPDIFQVLGSWLDSMEARGFSPATMRGYGDSVLRAGRVVRKDPRSFTPDDVLAVLKGIGKQGPAKRSMAQALRSFYRFAEAEHLSGNPTRDVPMDPPRPRAAEALEPSEVRALLRAAFRKDPRRGWALMLLYATGGRIGSLVAVMPEDVSAKFIRFTNMKGRHGPHDVPLSPLAQIAARHLAELPPGPRPTLVGVGKGAVWQWVNQAAKDAGVSVKGRPAWPHLLRHTAATVAYEATMDPLGLAEFLGHADLRQIRRYVARVDPRKRRAAEAVRL
jgi:integrase